MLVLLSISFTYNLASCLTTTFTAGMFALVVEDLDLPKQVLSLTDNFPALRALTHLHVILGA